MFNWLKRLKKTNMKKLIVIDIGYNSHRLSKSLLAIGNYQIVAFIDEEPWNHLNLLSQAKIHYPSELLALAKKHGVDGVLRFEGMGWQPDQDCLSALANLNVEYISLVKEHSVDEQIDLVTLRLSSKS